MKKMEKRRTCCVCILLCFSLLMTGLQKFPVSAKTQGSSSKQKIKVAKQTKKRERNRYYKDSAFIGNSIGKGMQLYLRSSGKGTLGHMTMMVRGCYSFMNDANPRSAYRISYRGKRMRAKEAIAASKVKRVFINMGSNDLWKPSAQTYQDYVKYIRGIRKRNPKVVIFIQGTPPMCSARNRKYLNNSAIRDLNRRIEKYCEARKDLYYVDISKGLKTASGGLQRKYSSDGYVHMTMSGYRIWASNLNVYVNKLLLQEKNAKKAVDRAAQNKTKAAYDTAKKWVDRLEKSTVKEKLQQRLKRIKKKIKKPKSKSDKKNGKIKESPAPEESTVPEESTESEGSVVPEGSATPEARGIYEKTN